MLDELRDDGNEIVYCKQTKKFRVGWLFDETSITH
jgi:hypothetical protein